MKNSETLKARHSLIFALARILYSQVQTAQSVPGSETVKTGFVITCRMLAAPFHESDLQRYSSPLRQAAAVVAD